MHLAFPRKFLRANQIPQIYTEANQMPEFIELLQLTLWTNATKLIYNLPTVSISKRIGLLTDSTVNNPFSPYIRTCPIVNEFK